MTNILAIAAVTLAALWVCPALAAEPLSAAELASLNAGIEHLCESPSEDCQVSPSLLGGKAAAYPAQALAQGRAGKVVARIVISPSGTASDIAIFSSSGPEFTDEVLAALRTWEFRPARWNGQKVPVCVTIPFPFSVDRR